jgi:hypothetical protein
MNGVKLDGNRVRLLSASSNLFTILSSIASRHIFLKMNKKVIYHKKEPLDTEESDLT